MPQTNVFCVSIILLSMGCNGNKEEEISNGSNGCVDTEYEGSFLCDAWLYNTSGKKSAVLQEDGAGILTDIAYTTLSTEDDVDYLIIETSGVPSYEWKADQSDVDWLNNRPNASTDFVDGETLAQVGVTYSFGADIGYRSSTDCDTGAGYGWWPPGPMCPSNQYKSVALPLNPQPQASGSRCETGLGALGIFVNGVSVYNWSDGASYSNQNVWYNVAAKYEVYDLGPCNGHAANGDYHHHNLSSCLMEAVGETGSGHSDIYGFAADGYPIYGPYVSSGVEAQSCWVARDYTNPNDPYGCGGTGDRTCLMVDPFQPELGTENASQSGPSTNEIVTSMSGNNFTATSGFYKEDYYYNTDCTDQGLAYLDEFNGHDHDDLGYHYHITATYPYFTGPLLYGVVHSNNSTSCDGVSGMGPGGPGGPQ